MDLISLQLGKQWVHAKVKKPFTVINSDLKSPFQPFQLPKIRVTNSKESSIKNTQKPTTQSGWKILVFNKRKTNFQIPCFKIICSKPANLLLSDNFLLWVSDLITWFCLYFKGYNFKLLSSYFFTNKTNIYSLHEKIYFFRRSTRLYA